MARGGSVSYIRYTFLPTRSANLGSGRAGRHSTSSTTARRAPSSRLEESAGGRDIRISGGADVIQQYLNMGVIDELEIALAPVLFGGGRRLFENLHEAVPQFRIDKVFDSPAATHLRYVRDKGRPNNRLHPFFHVYEATVMTTLPFLCPVSA